MATLLGMALFVPLILSGVQNSMANAQNAPFLWLPKESELRKTFLQFVRDFGQHDVLVVSWQGCTVDDPRLLRFAEEISAPHRRQWVQSKTNLSGEVVDGYRVLRQMTEQPPIISRSRALKQLQGSLVGDDGQTSCALLKYQGRQKERREPTIEFILKIAESAGVPREELHLAGSLVEGLAIDTESTRSFHLFAAPSAALVLLLCWCCLRSLMLSVAVLAVAGFCELLVIAMVDWLGFEMNAVLIVMAPLMLVITVSSGVHLVHYFKQALSTDVVGDAASRAMSVGWWPCTLCAVTTAMGMASLTVSHMRPVRHFGSITSCGVLIALGLLFAVLAGAMHCSSRNMRSNRPRKPSIDVGRYWSRAAQVLALRSILVTLICLSLMAAGLYGVTRISTTVKVVDLLSPDHRLVQDYRWLEANLGPMLPIDVIVQIPRTAELDPLEQVEIVRRVDIRMRQMQELDGVMSATTFLPEITAPGGLRRTALRIALRSRIERMRPRLVEDAWLFRSDHADAWRVTARVPAFMDIDYQRLLDDIADNAEQVIEEGNPHEIRIVVSGMTPLVAQAQLLLLDDLFKSFLTALLLIFTTLWVVFRSLSLSLIAMVPNIFPCLVLFGSMGLMGWQIDIGTVMTASIALGIAVDDTVHFLIWYRRGISRGHGRTKCVAEAMQHTAVAMMQTTLICGIGLALFVFSHFLPMQRFAWMLIALLGAALIGDLLLLPALLLGPLGRLAMPNLQGNNAGRSNGSDDVPDGSIQSDP